jgi:transcriptional regulator with XRE-family HTH domain
MAEHREESADEIFGMNLRKVREAANMSQAALAEAMTGRGHAWHQQTVGRVEAGHQPARWKEAVDVAKILRTTTDRFTWGTAEANETDFTYAAGTRVRYQYEEVADGIRNHLAAVAAAERLLARPPATDSPRVNAAREDVAERLKEYSARNAIREGFRRYRERGNREGSDDAQGES